MNALSLEAINRQTPYKVAESEEPNYFEFFTKYDVHYSVGFMADEDLMQSEAYHLIIINVDNRRSPNDLGVKETVLAIIEEFFNQNVASLLYIRFVANCSSDGFIHTTRKRIILSSLRQL